LSSDAGSSLWGVIVSGFSIFKCFGTAFYLSRKFIIMKYEEQEAATPVKVRDTVP